MTQPTYDISRENRYARVSGSLERTGIPARELDIPMPPREAYVFATPTPFPVSLTPANFTISYALDNEGTWHAAVAELTGPARDEHGLIHGPEATRMFLWPGVPGARIIPLLADPAPSAQPPQWLTELADLYKPTEDTP